MNEQMKKITMALAVAVTAIIAILGVLFFGGVIPRGKKEEPKVEKYVLNHDTDKKNISWSGENYTVQIGYDKKASVEKLSFGGVEILDSSLGIYTGYKTGGESEEESFSSLSLTEDPKLEIDYGQNTIMLSYEDEYTMNTVTFALLPDRIDMTFERTALRDVTMSDQSFPSINTAQDCAESIRWEKSGANFWVGGRASELKNFLAAGTGYRAEKESDIYLGNVRRAVRDISFSVLTDGGNGVAASFSGEVIEGGENTEAATQVQRTENNGVLPLEMSIIVSNGKKLYCKGSPDGWGSYGGRIVSQGEKIYRDVSFAAGDKTTVRFTVKGEDYDSYYDLGTLYGVDEKSISKILNDYGRMMIMDSDMGTALENVNHFFELPALEQHWNTNLIGILGDDAALETQKNGLRNIRKKLQAKDGHITSPYPDARGDGWGSKYSDMMPAYVISIIDTYILSGDKSFLDEMRESAEMALAAQENMYISGGVYICRNLSNSESINANDYWEHNSGKYNGYTTPMYYQALIRLAEVERNIYGDLAKADEYEELAAKIRRDYNEIMWSEETGSFLYGDESHDIVYLPVQAAVLSSGIAYEGREELIAAAVERAAGVYDLSYHVMNIVDLGNGSKPADQSDDYRYSMAGMNGGWYGAPDGEFYAAFPIYGDRTLIPRYISGLVKQFELTGFVNATCYKRDGVSPGDYGWWDLMPTMAYPIWGLYRYGYGFSPKLDGLYIEPFIDPSMAGSAVNYRWRGQDMTVTYGGIYDFTVETEELPTDIYVCFIRQTPGKSYRVEIDGKTVEVKAGEDGTVKIKLDKAGTTKLCLLSPDSENTAPSGTNAALGRPVSASSTLYGDTSTACWTDCLTDGKYNKFWQAERSTEGNQWLRISLGNAYDISKIKLSFSEQASFGYIIEGSNDPLLERWSTVADAAASAVNVQKDGALDIDIAGKAEYHYFRITFYGAADYEKICISEIEAIVR